MQNSKKRTKADKKNCHEKAGEDRKLKRKKKVESMKCKENISFIKLTRFTTHEIVID